MKKLTILTDALTIIAMFIAVVPSLHAGYIQKSQIDKLPEGWSVSRVLPAISETSPEWYDYDKYNLIGQAIEPKGKRIWDLEKEGKLVLLKHTLKTEGKNYTQERGEVLHWLRQWFDCNPELIRIDRVTFDYTEKKSIWNISITPTGFCDGYTGYDRYYENRALPLGWDISLDRSNNPNLPRWDDYDAYNLMGLAVEPKGKNIWDLENRLVFLKYTLKTTNKDTSENIIRNGIIEKCFRCDPQLIKVKKENSNQWSIYFIPPGFRDGYTEYDRYCEKRSFPLGWELSLVKGRDSNPPRWDDYDAYNLMGLAVEPKGKYIWDLEKEGKLVFLKYTLTTTNKDVLKDIIRKGIEKYFNFDPQLIKIERYNSKLWSIQVIPSGFCDGYTGYDRYRENRALPLGWELSLDASHYPDLPKWNNYDAYYLKGLSVGSKDKYIWDLDRVYLVFLKYVLKTKDKNVQQDIISRELSKYFKCDPQLIRGSKDNPNQWTICIIPQGFFDGYTGYDRYHAERGIPVGCKLERITEWLLPDINEYSTYFEMGKEVKPKGRYIWDLEKEGKLIFLEYIISSEKRIFLTEYDKQQIIRELGYCFKCDPQLIRISKQESPYSLLFKIIPRGFCDGYTYAPPPRMDVP